jgi:ElaB/YqjD/DUF883 family membrane-anchored ribosome-binding protein
MIQHGGSSFPDERDGDGSMGAPGALGAAYGAAHAPGPVAPEVAGGPRGTGASPDRPGDGGATRTRSEETRRSEFGAFLDDPSTLARRGDHTVDLRDEIERRVSRARARMNEALDQGAALSARAREQMSRGVEVSRDAVADRPLSFLAMAALGGLVLGLLLARRD